MASLRLIWIDCEMTGLDLDKDKLMEIACIVTEGDTLGDGGQDRVHHHPSGRRESREHARVVRQAARGQRAHPGVQGEQGQLRRGREDGAGHGDQAHHQGRVPPGR